MRPSGAWRVFGLLLTAAAGVAADEPPPHEVRIAGREVVQPAGARLVLQHGDAVRIRWRSDEAVDLHVHGYDLLVRVEADAPTETAFEARATGRFPVTSHGFGSERGGHAHGAPLLFIEVHPR